MAKKPLVNSRPVSEFGASAVDDVGDLRPIDLLEVPGFSAMRHQRDVELGEYNRGERLGQDVSALPANVRWVGITKGVRDEPTSVKLMRAANLGYQPVKATQVGKEPWLTAMPPGARQLPDGSIVNAAGDLQLHWAPAAVAARNQARKDRASRDLVDSVGNHLGNEAEGMNATVGARAVIADRTVRSTPNS